MGGDDRQDPVVPTLTTGVASRYPAIMIGMVCAMAARLGSSKAKPGMRSAGASNLAFSR